MKHSTTLVDNIDKSFLKEWQPFEAINKQVEIAILSHFMKHTYLWQPTHDEKSKVAFHPVTFTQIDNTLGLAYTSTGMYAGLWVCNGGYLWANDRYYFIGFAVTKGGKVVGIAHDYDENELFIQL